MITIVASCSVQPGSTEALKKLALDLVAASRNEAGNVSYDFFEDLSDPATFTFIEAWKDRAAIDSHNATPHFQDFVEKAGPLFAGPLSIGLYRQLS